MLKVNRSERLQLELHCWIIPVIWLSLSGRTTLCYCVILILFIYLFLAVLGLPCSAQAFSSCDERELLSSWNAWTSHCSGFSCWRAWAEGCRTSVVVVPGLWSTGSIVVAHGFSCHVACGIFLDQELNPCLLYWQVDFFLPLSHQGSPYYVILYSYIIQVWWLDVAYQAPPSMEFSRQEYWSGLPFSSGDLPDPGIEPRSPTLQADSLPSEPPGKPSHNPGASK